MKSDICILEERDDKFYLHIELSKDKVNTSEHHNKQARNTALIAA